MSVTVPEICVDLIPMETSLSSLCVCIQHAGDVKQDDIRPMVYYEYMSQVNRSGTKRTSSIVHSVWSSGILTLHVELQISSESDYAFCKRLF
jgi:hypothetical protein